MELRRDTAAGRASHPDTTAHHRQHPMKSWGRRRHPLLRTNADPGGTRVFGTFANCAAGKTPWGTYLTSEEERDDYFANGRHIERAPRARLDRRRTPFHCANAFSTVGTAGSALRCGARAEEFFRFGWMVEAIRAIRHRHRASARRSGASRTKDANTIVGRSGHVAHTWATTKSSSTYTSS